MKREELINKLSEITVVATPMVKTMDMGLQYDYITSTGAGTSLGLMGDWPVYRINEIAPDQWKTIRDKIRYRTIKESDFIGTGIEEIINNLHAIYGNQYDEYYGDTATVFEKMLSLPESFPTECYCLLDIYTPGEKPEFFAEKNKLQIAFKDKYCKDIIKWEDMSDDEINDWAARLEEDLVGLAVNII